MNINANSDLNKDISRANDHIDHIKKGFSFKAEYLLCIVAVLLPALMAGVVALIYRIKLGGGYVSIPVWNDEAAYYAQVKMLLNYGVSEGYWGFAGGHAVLGTGGAWSAAILLPYALFGRLFGWGYSSVAVANVVYLCIANALFLILVKADKKVCFRFILTELFSVHLWLYTGTQMSEILRYAFAIVLAGMIHHLFFAKKNPVWFKILVGLYLLYLMQAYIFFSFAVLIYVFALMKDIKLKGFKGFLVKLLAGFLGMAVAAGGSYYVLHLISSNYNIFKTEALFECLKAHDIIGAVKEFFCMTKFGIRDMFVIFRGAAGHGLFVVFMPACVLLCLVPVVYLIIGAVRRKKGVDVSTGFDNSNSLIHRVIGDDHETSVLLIFAYSMILYIGTYITVYSLEPFTFFRGVGIPILFVFSLLACAEFKPRNILLWFIYFVAVIFIPVNMAEFSAERYVSEEEVLKWDELASEFETCLEIEKPVYLTSADEAESIELLEEHRWNNTVILFTMEPKVISSLPAGLGQNYMMMETRLVNEKAGYLLLPRKYDAESDNLRFDWAEQSFESVYETNKDIIDSYYTLIYESDDHLIYKHN